MKIKYLGTAAAEAVPAVFCACDVCKKSRELGGRNIRTRSQAIVDGKLLLDFPCDTYLHLLQYNMDLCDFEACLITHVHEDHFYPLDMANIRPGFSHPPKDYVFNVYGSEDILDGTEEMQEKSAGQLKFNAVKPFEPFEVLGYTVTALKARHGTAHPYLYLISNGEKTMLYAHDTGLFPEETLEYLSGVGHIDFASLDCTGGANERLSYDSHMCLGFAKQTREKLAEMHLTDEKTVFVLNHFSHNGRNAVYDDFSKIAAADGFITSYDGMEIEF